MNASPAAAEATLIATPLRSALLAGHANLVQLLVRIQAPDWPSDQRRPRPPYGTSLVIDRSGSMRGTPLAEALRCAGFMIDRLDAGDQAALVIFDQDVEVLKPLTPLSERQALRQALGRAQVGGMTNLHGGWAAGAAELARGEPALGLRRVILLSDGQANEGVVDPLQICADVARLAGQGVSTSTYGLGRDFNEALMVDMARAGCGSHYYAASADDLLESFSDEFELLANLWVKGLSLRLRLAEGVSARLLNDYLPVAGTGNAWSLPDLAFGAEAWALLALTVPAGLCTGPAAVTLGAFEFAGTAIDGAQVVLQSAPLALPVLPAAAYAALAEDELVRRRMDELEAAALLKEARAAALNADWTQVVALIAKARARFDGNPWLAELLATMDQLAGSRDEAGFAKEAYYSSMCMSRRLAGKDESAMLDEGRKAAYLRRKPTQGKRSGP